MDYWEWQQNKEFELFMPQAKDYQALVKEVDHRVSFVAPLYLFRLRQAAHLIEMSNWENKKEILKVNDVHLEKPLPETCKVVQLAVRSHRDSYENVLGQGPSAKVPEVKMEFDQDLFSRLDLMNQAILIYHERMYLMAQTIGHKDSDKIRPLVMRLFEKDLLKPASSAGRNFYLRPSLVYYFGDHILYFENLSLAAKNFTQESRFNSFIEMLKVIRSKIGECRKLQKMTPRECQDIAMDPDENKKWFTDEMAFVFYTYFVLDNTNNLLNSELLIAPIKDEEFVVESQRLLIANCKVFKQYREKLVLPDITEKALNYCSHLGL